MVREAIKKGIRVVLIMTALTCICSKWIGAAFAASKVAVIEPAVIMFSLSFIPGMFNNLYIFYYFTTEKVGLANMLTFLRNFVFVIVFAIHFVYWKIPQLICLSFMASELATLAAIFAIAGLRCIRNKYLRGLLMLDCRYEEIDRYLAFSVENTKEEAGSEVLMDDSLGIEMIVKRAAEVMFSRTFGVNNLTIVIYENKCIESRKNRW